MFIPIWLHSYRYRFLPNLLCFYRYPFLPYYFIYLGSYYIFLQILLSSYRCLCSYHARVFQWLLYLWILVDLTWILPQVDIIIFLFECTFNLFNCQVIDWLHPVWMSAGVCGSRECGCNKDGYKQSVDGYGTKLSTLSSHWPTGHVWEHPQRDVLCSNSYTASRYEWNGWNCLSTVYLATWLASLSIWLDSLSTKLAS